MHLFSPSDCGFNGNYLNFHDKTKQKVIGGKKNNGIRAFFFFPTRYFQTAKKPSFQVKTKRTHIHAKREDEKMYE